MFECSLSFDEANELWLAARCYAKKTQLEVDEARKCGDELKAEILEVSVKRMNSHADRLMASINAHLSA